MGRRENASSLQEGIKGRGSDVALVSAADKAHLPTGC